MTKWRITALISAALWFAADYFSKVWADSVLKAGDIYVNAWMDFKLGYNYGAAFSFLSSEGGWQRWFFTIIAIVIGAWLLYEIVRKSHHPIMYLAYASILGGAMGNLYDRIVHGYVIDFIHWHYQEHSWPIFNIADVGICVGVGLMILMWFIEMKGKNA